MSGKPLYDLLPEMYRKADLLQGQPLRALLAAIEEQRTLLHQDIEGLYDNWFIETCSSWVVPYLAGQVGVPPFDPNTGLGPNLRRWVANMIAYRRRKGTISATEMVITDLTGWPAKVKATIKPQPTAESAFVPACVEAPGLPGRLKIFLWRYNAFPLTQVTPRYFPGRGYTFHPLGVDSPLLNNPPPLQGPESVSGQRNFPERLQSQVFHHEIAALQAGRKPATDYLTYRPAFQIFVREKGGPTWCPIAPTKLAIASLENWQTPETGSEIEAIVDPERGRLLLPHLPPWEPIRVSFSYGLAGECGGGPYGREMHQPTDATWVGYVLEGAGPDLPRRIFPSVEAALTEFARTPGDGIIRILDSATYYLPTNLTVGAEAKDCTGSCACFRTLVIEAHSGETPCLLGTLRMVGPEAGMNVVLNGLWLEGPLQLGGNLVLNLRHCTVCPVPYESGRASICAALGDQRNNLHVNLDSCIIGSIQFSESVGRLSLCASDSIVDGSRSVALGGVSSEAAPQSSETVASLLRTTVFGSINVTELKSVSDTLVTGEVKVKREAQGYIRYSCVPDAGTPPRYACKSYDVPYLESVFASPFYGQPGYALLANGAPQEISTGAFNGFQMGAFYRQGPASRPLALSSLEKEYFPEWLIPEFHCPD